MKVPVKEIIENFDQFKGRLVKNFPGVEDEVCELLSVYSIYDVDFTDQKSVSFWVRTMNGNKVCFVASTTHKLDILPKLKSELLKRGSV